MGGCPQQISCSAAGQRLPANAECPSPAPPQQGWAVQGNSPGVPTPVASACPSGRATPLLQLGAGQQSPQGVVTVRSTTPNSGRPTPSREQQRGGTCCRDLALRLASALLGTLSAPLLCYFTRAVQCKASASLCSEFFFQGVFFCM